MNREQLFDLFDTALTESGYPGATVVRKTRKLSQPVCQEGNRASVSVFTFVHDDQPEHTLQSISALSVPEADPVIVVGAENESAESLAERTLDTACFLHGCKANTDQCLFAGTRR